jgi:hypothetical protein
MTELDTRSIHTCIILPQAVTFSRRQGVRLKLYRRVEPTRTWRRGTPCLRSRGPANPGSFSLYARNGLTPMDPANFAGFTLGPRSQTPEFQIGLTASAKPGDIATFTVNSNDPLNPSVTTQLSVGTTL